MPSKTQTYLTTLTPLRSIAAYEKIRFKKTCDADFLPLAKMNRDMVVMKYFPKTL